tara:strand:- start:567 stop:740 length:174 start_codon:yes stop_codon:yes gene_type:complete
MNSYEVGVTVRFSWEAEDVDSEEEAIEEAMQALSENGGNPYEVFSPDDEPKFEARRN